MVSTAWLPSRSMMRSTRPSLMSRVQPSPEPTTWLWLAVAGSRGLVVMVMAASAEEQFGAVEAAGGLRPRDAAGILRPRRVGMPQPDADGLRRVVRGRVQGVRDGGEHRQDLHLRAQVDGRAGAAVAGHEAQRGLLVRRDLGEEVDVGDDV